MLKASGLAFWRMQGFGPRAWLSAAIALAVLLPLGAWMWVAFEIRGRAYEAAQGSQRRATETLRQYTLKLFETHALALDLVNNQAGERDCATLRADVALQDFLTAAARVATPTGGIWITDVDGYLCVSSNPRLMDARSRRFREYFEGARNAAPGRYYVDRAVTALIAGTVIFNMTRPRIKDGAFNGVILISVGFTELMQAWREMLGTILTGQTALFREDGATILRSWEPFVPALDASAEARMAEVWRTSPNGVSIGPSPINGAGRVTAWRRLPDWGVVVSSSIAETEVRRLWLQPVLIYGALAGLASVLVALLAWLLLRGQRMLSRVVEQRTRSLRVTEDRLSLFIDGAPAAIALFDTQMCFLAVSRRYIHDMGLGLVRPDELVGRSIYKVFTNVTDHWRDNHRRVLAGETLAAEEDVCLRADGASDWTHWELAPWYQLDGLIGGAVLFSEVVTARKQAEAILTRGKAELERLVTDRTQELEATQARLAQAQRMQALGQLAGGIAHDINNVIQAVQGGAALIERRPGDVDRTRSLARMIMEAAERGAAVTRRILVFAHQSHLQAEPLDALTLFTGLAEILAPSLGVHIDIKVAASVDLPPLLADKAQLETVLINLATNARDAMPRGGTLTFDAVLDRLHSGSGPDHPIALRAGSYVRLSVSDNGSGMPPEVLARASEPFFTTKDVGQGTGLGLAMARGFTEQSGGGLRIESAPAWGTIINLWFPVSTRVSLAVGQLPTSKDTVALTPARGRLLMVDDDPIVRETLAEQMEAEGHTVLTAVCGADALILLDAGEAIDLLVTDHAMPGMNGTTLISEARRRRPSLPAILLTGFTANAAIDSDISGTFTLLRKPTAGPVLAKCVADLLERARGVGETEVHAIRGPLGQRP